MTHYIAFWLIGLGFVVIVAVVITANWVVIELRDFLNTRYRPQCQCRLATMADSDRKLSDAQRWRGDLPGLDHHLRVVIGPDWVQQIQEATGTPPHRCSMRSVLQSAKELITGR